MDINSFITGYETPTYNRSVEQLQQRANEVGYSVDKKTTERYASQGYNYNPWEFIDYQMANKQSGWSKLGNSLLQTLVSEIGLGTIKGFTDLVDVIGQAIGLSDHNYTNPASQKLEQWQEEFKNSHPINVDPRINIGNGGLTDVGWWASNIPSIASSLTLLVPSMAGTKVVTGLGKLVKAGNLTKRGLRAITGAQRRLNKAKALREAGKAEEAMQVMENMNAVERGLNVLNKPGFQNSAKNFLENGLTAAMSRAVENHQEARQTYSQVMSDVYSKLKLWKNSSNEEDQQKLQDFIERNKEYLKDEQGNQIDTEDIGGMAKAIAARAADKTFQTDWLNVVFDVYEMWAIRNAWKGLKGGNTSASSRRYAKDRAKYRGKTPEEIAEIKAKQSWGTRAAEKLGDNLRDGKHLVLSQLSEGVEEAVNYIAQEEGMRVGQFMLGEVEGKDGELENGFLHNFANFFKGYDGRLTSYVQNPELWDAAFWGALGGIVFTAGGNKLYAARNSWEEKRKRKNNKNTETIDKLDEQTFGEKISSFFELPQEKRDRAMIDANVKAFDQVMADIEDINNGINPYIKKELIGKEKEEYKDVTLLDDESKEEVKQQLFNEFLARETISSLKSGTYDMWETFITDENITNELKNNGIIKENSNQFLNDVKNRIEHIENIYDNELMSLNNLATSINNDVPIEFLQIIATNNTYNRIRLDENKKRINKYDNEISALSNDLLENSNLTNEKLEDYEHNLLFLNKLERLRNLYADYKDISKQEKSISKEISLKNIKKEIATLEKDLSQEELARLTFNALAAEKIDGKVTVVNPNMHNEDQIAYINNVLKQTDESKAGKIMSIEGLDWLSERARTALTAEQSEVAFKTNNDINKNLTEFEKDYPELSNKLNDRNLLSQFNDKLRLGLVMTASQMAEETDYLNKTVTEAATKARTEAVNTIFELYNKYSDVKGSFKNSINTFYSNSENFINSVKRYATEDEAEKLADALRILDLSKPSNIGYAEFLDGLLRANDDEIIANIDETEPTENDETSNNEEEPVVFDTGENQQISDEENIEQTNTTSFDNQSQNEEENTQIEGIQIPEESKSNISDGFALININPNGEISVTQDSESENNFNAYLEKRVDTTDEYTLFCDSVPENIDILTNPNLYNFTDATGNFTVASEPIIKIDENGKVNVIKKGELVNPDSVSGQETLAKEEQRKQIEEENKANEDQQSSENIDDTSSTGVLQPNITQKPEIAALNPENVTEAETTSNNVITEEPTPQLETIVENKTEETSNTTAFDIDNLTAFKSACTLQIRKQAKEMAKVAKDESLSKEEKETKLKNVVDYINNKILPALKRKGGELGLSEAVIKTVIGDNVNKNIEQLVKATKQEADIIELALLSQDLSEYMGDNKLSNIFNSDINEINPIKQIMNQYTNTLNNVIKNYLKEYGYDSKDAINLVLPDGKIFISSESLLRYVNDITHDKTMAEVLYTNLLNYFNSTEGRNKYVITDIEEMKSHNFLDKVLMEIGERARKELTQEGNVVEVDLVSQLEYLDSEQEDKHWEAINTIQRGEELITKMGTNDIRIEYYTKDGKFIGTVTIPKTDNGYMYVPTEGWNIAVANNNNHIDCPFAEDIRPLISPTKNTPAATVELHKALIQLTYDKTLSKEKRIELEDKIIESDYYKSLREYFYDLAPDRDRVRHLTKLIKYSNVGSPQMNEAVKKVKLKSKLDSWIKKLYESYNNAAMLKSSNDPNGEFSVKVESISGDEINQISTNVQEGAQNALPPSKAFAKPVNPNVVKIAYMGSSDGLLTISGEESIRVAGMTRNSLAVLIPQRDGKRGFATAWPITAKENIGKDAKEIIKAIKNEFRNLFKAHFAEPSNKTYNDIVEFVKKTFDNRANYRSIFDNVLNFESNLSDGNKVFSINIPNTNHSITFYKFRKGSKIFSSKVALPKVNGKNQIYDVTDERILNAIDNLIDNARFRVSPSLLTSDKISNMKFDGIAKRANNGFEIQIGDNTWHYNSYNEFVLTNDLIKLNMKPNENGTSNFKSLNAESPYLNLTIRVTKRNTPVEESKETVTESQSSTQSAVTSISQQLSTIIPTEASKVAEEHIGQKIAEIAYPVDDTVEGKENQEVLNSLKDLNLLPKIVIFDSKLDNREGVNANSDKKTEIVRVGTRWKDMFTNPTSRKTAIKKLMHEQLHLRLGKRKEWSKKAFNIYNEFKAFLEKNPIDNEIIQKLAKERNVSAQEFVNHLHEYLFEKYENEITNMKEEDLKKNAKEKNMSEQEYVYNALLAAQNRKLEEFFVESVTSSEFAELLGSIESTTETFNETKKSTLFDKIMNFLKKLFGINVKDNSLFTHAVDVVTREMSKRDTAKENAAKRKSKSKTSTSTTVTNSSSTSTKASSVSTNKVKAAETVPNKKRNDATAVQLSLFDNAMLPAPKTEVSSPKVPETSETPQTSENQSSTSSEPVEKTETEKLIDTIISDGESVHLTENELFYIDEKTGIIYDRVTNAITAQYRNLDSDGKPHPFTENGYKIPSTNVGTGVDEFVRDFFLGKLDNLTAVELANQYPNASAEQWDKFRTDLIELKDKLAEGKVIPNKKITIVSRDIKANGTLYVDMPDGTTESLTVNGTLDLLGYDEDGKFYIFDMKTKHSEYVDNGQKNKWASQLGVYKEFLEEKYGLEVAQCAIIQIPVNYPTPAGEKDGTAVYTVKYPDLHNDYDNPNRCQLLINGEEFKDAAPGHWTINRMNVTTNSHDSRIKYDALPQKSKDLIDGKINKDNVENYVDATTVVEETSEASVDSVVEKPVVPESIINKAIPAEYNKGAMTELDEDDVESSVTEIEKTDSEIDIIKNRAIADNTFMKAPNGADTKLTEQQWLQVRTKAFKDWFGNWENVNDIESNIDKIDTSKVTVENRPWKGNENKRSLWLSLNNQPEKGAFVLVKDDEINQYSIHFKTATETGEHNTKDTAVSTKEERKTLFKEFVKLIPNGAIISTWGEISNDGIRGLDNVGRDMTKIGTRTIKHKDGNVDVEIPIYQKSSNVSRVVDENGEPLVVYRNMEKPYNTMRNNTYFTTDKSYADKYNYGYTGEYFLNIKNITNKTERDEEGWPIDSLNSAVSERYFNDNPNIDGIVGHDAIFMENIEEDHISRGEEYVVRNPNQVKSATDNSGEFSSSDDNIYNSSVTEYEKIQSPNAYLNTIPNELRYKMQTQLNDGTKKTMCK